MMSRMQKKLLAYLSLSMLTLLGVCNLGIYTMHTDDIHNQADQQQQKARILLAKTIEHEAYDLSGLLTLAGESAYLRRHWMTADRAALLRCAEPIHHRIKTQNDIFAWNFIAADRTCFLRVHDPSRHGDRLDYPTLCAAEQTQQLCYGLELEKNGGFFLRVITPWYIDGRLAGYLELGKSMHDIVPELSRILHARLICLIDKALLDRTSRQPDLGTVAGHVISAHTFGAVPVARLHELLKTGDGDPYAPHYHIALDDHRYEGCSFPIIDAGNRAVAKLMVLDDVTERYRLRNHLMLGVTVAGLLIAVIIGAFFHKAAGAMETALRQSNQLVRQETRQRAQAETKLIDRKNRFQAITATTPDSIVLVNDRAEIVFWNESAAQLFGYTREEILGRPAVTLLPENLREGTGQWVGGLLERGNTSAGHRIESVAVSKTGREFPVSVSSCAWENNGTSFVCAIVRDITAQRETERELRQAHESLDNVFQASPDMIMVTDVRGFILSLNRAVFETLGYRPSELIGCHAREMFPVRWHERMIPILGDLFTLGIIRHRDMVLRSKDGAELPCEINAAIMHDSNGDPSGAVSILRDCSRRKQLEDYIRHTHRREATATLAGGIAHNFNNILGAIIGHADLCLDEFGSAPDARDSLEAIIGAALRGRNLVQDLRTIAGSNTETREAIPVQQEITECIQVINATAPPQVCLHSTFDLDGDTVRSNRAQFRTILLNLGLNALDALEGGSGSVSIDARTVSLHTSDIPHGEKNACPGRYLKITVSDTGTGIRPEHRPRIFDPFFTTRNLAERAGLGLTITQRIVNDHQGFLIVDSVPGNGTCVAVHLPLPSRKSGGTMDGTSRSPAETRILLVEDENDLAALASEALTRQGYSVCVETDSRAALGTVLARAADFSLIISDFSMPGLNGLQLAERARGAGYTMPFIITSGDTAQIDKSAADRLCVSLLQKPFGCRSLTATVRSILGDQSA